jgi:hypothetical protein
MSQRITIVLPGAVPERDAREVQNWLERLDSVDKVSQVTTRSAIDPASIIFWIQITSGVLGAVGAMLPVIQKIIKIIRNKKISDATIRLPNGTEISLDESSAEEIVKILEASKAK